MREFLSNESRFLIDCKKLCIYVCAYFKPTYKWLIMPYVIITMAFLITLSGDHFA